MEGKMKTLLWTLLSVLLCVLPAKAGFVAPCDVEIFTRKIINILDDADLARQMGMNGIAHVRNNFSWQEIATRLLSMYSSLITKSI